MPDALAFCALLTFSYLLLHPSLRPIPKGIGIFLTIERQEAHDLIDIGTQCLTKAQQALIVGPCKENRQELKQDDRCYNQLGNTIKKQQTVTYKAPASRCHPGEGFSSCCHPFKTP